MGRRYMLVAIQTVLPLRKRWEQQMFRTIAEWCQLYSLTALFSNWDVSEQRHELSQQQTDAGIYKRLQGRSIGS
jgi:hypothetical protein